jgi:putative transposase
MNPIEVEWHQLKAREIAGQMFDNEYDPAKAIVSGMERRSEMGEYELKHFIFNCT